MVIGTVAFGSATPVKQAGLFSFEAFGLNIPEMLERTLSLQSNAQRYLRRAIQHASNTEVRMYADEAFLRSQRASEAAKLALDQAIKDGEPHKALQSMLDPQQVAMIPALQRVQRSHRRKPRDAKWVAAFL
mmetsp:Transcript_31287/g.71431  ORF Transcript_31287/g.71431 Transcript_31287/m.71431 type:complete len:131 (-) Transcript_31287:39-431(-)